MAKYTIDIPDELLPYMTENLPSVPAYLRAVLLTPLLERYQRDERERIFAEPLAALAGKLSAMEKNAKIKKEKKSFDESHLEETKDLPSTQAPEPVAPAPEPAPSVIVETIPAPEPVVETPPAEQPEAPTA